MATTPSKMHLDTSSLRKRPISRIKKLLQSEPVRPGRNRATRWRGLILYPRKPRLMTGLHGHIKYWVLLPTAAYPWAYKMDVDM